MIRAVLALMRKDVRLCRNSALVQALLLGLLLIFVFSLAQEVGEVFRPQGAAAVFWLASAFCQVLIFNMLYGLEEANGARAGLLLLPCPVQAVWLGKALTGLALLLTAQAAFLPAAMVFLGQDMALVYWQPPAMVLAADVGMAALGSLLGALGQGAVGGGAGRESLLSVVLFPLLIPLLLAAIRVCSAAFAPAADAAVILEGAHNWFGVALAFDALFLAAGLVLFPFVYAGDE